MSKKDTNDEIIFKIITLGNSGVGKTSILKRYIYNKFTFDIMSTIGVSFAFKEVTLKNGVIVKLKLIDTTGQEKYKSLAQSYFKNADGVLFVFSLNDKETLDNLDYWVKSLEESNMANYFIAKYLVGNKNDLEIKVNEELINNFKKCHNFLDYVSSSAKDDININKIFQDMSEILYNNYIEKGKKGQKNIKLEKIKKKSKNVKCIKCLQDS